jgi:hypothetical protein
MITEDWRTSLLDSLVHLAPGEVAPGPHMTKAAHERIDLTGLDRRIRQTPSASRERQRSKSYFALEQRGEPG